MFGLFKRKPKKKDPVKKPENPADSSGELTTSLDRNIAVLEAIFADVDVLSIRQVQGNFGPRCYALYCSGMTDKHVINRDLIDPLMTADPLPAGENLLDGVASRIIRVNCIKKTGRLEQIAESISTGDTVLLIDGQNQALLLDTRACPNRAVMEPENERVLVGPREGFTESLLENLSMIRRRALTADLKMKYRTIGTRTRTKMCICYFKGVVNESALAELETRLARIDIDAVLDTNYISELIRDARWSPFRTTGYTERPDVVVGKLLEGRIALLVEGSPMALTLPYLFVENFQSGEDYYMNFFYASFSRVLRIVGFFLTISIPALYIAVGGFHHEIFPLSLFISIAAERQSVPLSAAVEAFVMVIAFELLKEAGARMPTAIGQALSIAGALVIGQAAVQAQLVAAPMVIVIGLTGITGLLVPRLNAPVIYLQLGLLLLGSTFGLFGVLLGLSGILIHLINLRSFGVPQIMLSKTPKYQHVKDTAFRAPWWQMIMRPRFAANKVRQKDGKG